MAVSNYWMSQMNLYIYLAQPMHGRGETLRQGKKLIGRSDVSERNIGRQSFKRLGRNALDSPPAGRKTELLRWLTEEGRFAPDIGRLLEALCEKLTALGVPVARATAHVRTLHPEFRGATRIWRRGESIEIRTIRHGIEFTHDYQSSPIQYIIETGQ